MRVSTAWLVTLQTGLLSRDIATRRYGYLTLAVVSIVAKIDIVLKMHRFITYYRYKSVFDFLSFETFYTNSLIIVLMVPKGVNC